MAKLNYKIEDDEIQPKEKSLSEEEKKFNDKLDLYKFTADVHDELNKDIKADFVLSRLGEQDKTAVIEMTTNAYAVKHIIKLIKRKETKSVWNKERKQWEIKLLSREEKEEMEEVANGIFKTLMTKVKMTNIMNRNVDKNYLIKILSSYNEQDDEEQSEEEEKKGLVETIKSVFKKDKNNQGE